MSAVEIQVTWSGWVVLHQQLLSGERFTDPMWWPSEAIPLSTRLSWRDAEQPRLDGAPITTIGAAWREAMLDLRVRKVAITRAEDRRPPSSPFALGVGLAAGCITALAMLLSPGPPPVNEVIEIPDRFVEILLTQPEPPLHVVASFDGNGGGEDRAAPGSAGSLGEPDGPPDTPPPTGRPQLKHGVSIGKLTHEGEPQLGSWSVGRDAPEETPRAGAAVSDAGTGTGAEGLRDGYGAMGVSIDWQGWGEEGTGDEGGAPDTATDGRNVRPRLRVEVPMIDPAADPHSTFAVDIDTASYTRARTMLRQGRLPSPEEVRLEEFVNARDYDLPTPIGSAPVSITAELSRHPWGGGKRLLRVSLQAAAPPPAPAQEEGPMRLVFLVDVSGSMSAGDKLPLARQMLHELADTLPEDTEVALVTYASGSRLVLPLTALQERAALHEAIDELRSNGGTGMAEGLVTAYAMLAEAEGPGERRVMLVTDGDANVGPRTAAEMLSLIETQREATGTTLTGLGFGADSYSDRTLEELTNAGDGGYFFIDSAAHARELFVSGDIRRVLRTAVRDAKVQVRFSPEAVTGYRLLGYENRDVSDADFRTDDIDAGEMGQGQQVTALYELELREGAGNLGWATFRGRVEEHGAITEQGVRLRTSDMQRPGTDTQAALAAAALAGRLRGDAWAAGVSFNQIAALGDEETAELAHTTAVLWAEAVSPEQ